MRPPDHAQRQAALDLARNLLVLAPAGSGKTELLIQRVLAALADCDEPEQVVAVTFTRKAAGEIRARLLQALEEAADTTPPEAEHRLTTWTLARRVRERDQACGWHLQRHPGRLRALTIDALNGELANGVPLLSGLGGTAQIATQPQALYSQAILRLVDALEHPDTELDLADAIATLMRFADNRIDRLLPPLGDLLGRREQWLSELLDHDADALHAQCDQALQAVTAEAMASADASLDAEARTELAAILRDASGHHPQLAWAADLATWPAPDTAHWSEWQQLAATLFTAAGTLRSAKGVNIKSGFPPKLASTASFKAWLQAHEAQADALETAWSPLLSAPDPNYPTGMARLRDALSRVLTHLTAELKLVFASHGVCDFVEVAAAARAALRDESTGVGERADARIRHLLIDEMQDTSLSQVRLIKQLTGDWEPGDGRSLFLVGDPQQSIYLFRQADVGLFVDMQQRARLGHLPLEVLTLTANFRSSATLVEWFNRSFAALFPQRSDPQVGRVSYTPCEAIHPGEGGDGCHLHAAADADTETRQALDLIRRLRAEQPDANVAVLARSRKQLHGLVVTLRREGIEFASQDLDPLTRTPVVRDFLALYQALAHPADRLAWAVLLRAPIVGLSWADMVALSHGRTREPWPARLAAAAGLSDDGQARIERLRQVLASVEASERLRQNPLAATAAVWEMLGGHALADAVDRNNLNRLQALLREHCEAGLIRDEHAFAQAVDSLYAGTRAAPLELMTIHKSKGLQFDHVILIGAGNITRGGDGPLLQFRRVHDHLLVAPRPTRSVAKGDPDQRLYDYMRRLDGDAQKAEALRLLYVAATRAKRQLHVLAQIPESRGGPAPRGGSFAALLWPLLGDAAPLPEAVADAPPPSLIVPPRQWLPLEQLRPRSAAPPAHPPVAAATPDTENLEARLIGTMVHDAMRRISHDGVEHWRGRCADRRSAMAAGFRREGLAEGRITAATDRVVEVLEGALAGRGDWLLTAHPWARSEFGIGIRTETGIVHRIVDRCFIDAHGDFWVVDYKVSATPVAENARAHHLERAVAEHRQQVLAYARHLAAYKPGHRMRPALYFADLDELVELPFESTGR